MDDMDFDKRLKRLEQRMERSHQHLERVLLTQRENVEKGFDQVKIALLEQELALRKYGSETRESMTDLTDTVRDLRSSSVTTTAEIDDIKKRLDRLENPPAT